MLIIFFKCTQIAESLLSNWILFPKHLSLSHPWLQTACPCSSHTTDRGVHSIAEVTVDSHATLQLSLGTAVTAFHVKRSMNGKIPLFFQDKQKLATTERTDKAPMPSLGHLP